MLPLTHRLLLLKEILDVHVHPDLLLGLVPQLL